MKISMTDTGKRFNRDWIFRHFTKDFLTGQAYAITGHNGSGKSTLLQVIAGALTLSEGAIEFYQSEKKIDADLQFMQVAICAPYLELIEEMTALEFLDFHRHFKPMKDESSSTILAEVELSHAANKQIRYFSSGMKQRLKLAQAIFSETPVLLLDEPCTNLDKNGIALYHHLIEKYCGPKLIIVSSNDEVEYSFCKELISIQEFKQ
jgi:ABC-type multidrug transport system ATPase subunit